MNKKSVALLFGGESSEHEVSLASARNVYHAIDKTKYTITLIFVDKSGSWWLLSQFDDHTSPTVGLSVCPGSPTLVASDGRTITPDVLFPILHGRNGEDGSIQGLAQLLHLPVVGCDMTPSVLAMDKIASKEIMSYHGCEVLPFITHQSGEPVPSYDEVTQKLGSTLFVKPSRAGSSVGITRVSGESTYRKAIDDAHAHDTFILIEKAADNPRELEVAILGQPPHHQASVVGEIRPEGEFYSYDSKYSDSSHSEVIIPANLNEDTSQRVRKQALAAYAALKCRGMARVDFLLQGDTLYFNEINTIPGFTDISMYPKLWQASRLDYSSLIDTLIEQAA